MGHFDTPWTTNQTLLDVDHNGWHNAASALLAPGMPALDIEGNQVHYRRYSGVGNQLTKCYRWAPTPPPAIFDEHDTLDVNDAYWVFDWNAGGPTQLQALDKSGWLNTSSFQTDAYWDNAVLPPRTSFNLPKGIYSWSMTMQFGLPTPPDTQIWVALDYATRYNVGGANQFENTFNAIDQQAAPANDTLFYPQRAGNFGFLMVPRVDIPIVPILYTTAGSAINQKIEFVLIQLIRLVGGL